MVIMTDGQVRDDVIAPTDMRTLDDEIVGVLMFS